jgi:hypothetical protein
VNLTTGETADPAPLPFHVKLPYWAFRSPAGAVVPVGDAAIDGHPEMRVREPRWTSHLPLPPLDRPAGARKRSPSSTRTAPTRRVSRSIGTASVVGRRSPPQVSRRRTLISSTVRQPSSIDAFHVKRPLNGISNRNGLEMMARDGRRQGNDLTSLSRKERMRSLSRSDLRR